MREIESILMPFMVSVCFLYKKEGGSLDKYTYEGSNRVIIERFLLFVHTINSAIMLTICAKQEGGTYSSLCMLAGISLCWFCMWQKVRRMSSGR